MVLRLKRVYLNSAFAWSKELCRCQRMFYIHRGWRPRWILLDLQIIHILLRLGNYKYLLCRIDIIFWLFYCRSCSRPKRPHTTAGYRLLIVRKRLSNRLIFNLGEVRNVRKWIFLPDTTSTGNVSHTSTSFCKPPPNSKSYKRHFWQGYDKSSLYTL